MTNCKTKKLRSNLRKKIIGRFSVICLLFHPVKLTVYTSSHLNKQKDKVHRYSKSEIIIPIGCYIAFSGSLVHAGSKSFVQEKGECPSFIRLFFTIADKKYNHDVCELTHKLTKKDFCSTEFSKCLSFNTVSPISVIDLQKIVKLKKCNDGDVVYGDLDICGWCVLKCQSIN